jgi:HEAT repeat protein
MTEDTSPENLRKFLESDDPAMRRMGLSMAKGMGVPEELLPTILGLYMWDDDKSVRAAAKSVFNKYAPAEMQAKVKENWKPNYRTMSITGEKYPEIVNPFHEAFKSWDDFAEIVLEPLIKALGKGNSAAAGALEEIGGARAVEPLIKALDSSYRNVRRAAAEVLGEIGDTRAVEPLIKALGDEDDVVREAAKEALKNLGHDNL